MNTLIASLSRARDHTRQIARTSDGRLHVVFMKSSGGIYYAYSDDNGQTWSEFEQIEASAYAHGPAIASDSQNNIHVVWAKMYITTDCGVFYRKKDQDGWSSTETIYFISEKDQDSPAIAIDSQDIIHVVWTGEGLGNNPSHENIYYRKKDESGWSDIELVSDMQYDQADWVGPDIAIDSNDNIHVAWEGDNANGYHDVWYRKKTLGTWESIEVVNDIYTNYVECYHLSLALDSNDNPLIAWEGFNYLLGHYEIDYSTKIDGSWQKTTVAGGPTLRPSITLDSNDTIYIVYHDTDAGELKLVKKNESWSDPQTLIALDDYKAATGMSCLWAKYPNNVNIPNAGFACVYSWKTTSDTDVGAYFYSSSDFYFAMPPNKPTDLLCNGEINPTNIKDSTPSFSAIYSDPNNNNSSACEIHVATSQDKLDNPDMWDSGWITDNTASGERCSGKVYAGQPIDVEQNLVYYWKIRFKNIGGLESPWSDTAYFTTGDPTFLGKIFLSSRSDTKGSIRLTFYAFQETLNKVQELREYADLYQKGFIIPHTTVKNKIKVLFHDLQELLNKISLPNLYTDFLSREDIIPYSTLLNKIRLLFHEDIDILVQTFVKSKIFCKLPPR